MTGQDIEPRGLAVVKPKGSERTHHGRVIDELQRFDQEGVGSKFISAVDVEDVFGRSEDDNAQRFEAGLPAYPLQQFEPIEFRHFEVEKNQIRERILIALAILSLALEISHRLLAIMKNLEGITHVGLSQSAPDEKDVILAIFHQKNASLFGEFHAL